MPSEDGKFRLFINLDVNKSSKLHDLIISDLDT